MKKLFTLICAFVAWAGVVNAATVDDVAVCKHSYVLNCSDATNNGTVRPGKGVLFADGFILDVTGGSVATNKKSVDLGAKNEDDTYKYLNGKYADLGSSLNSLRLKNTQDVIAMRITAKSKVIFILNGNSKSGTAARYPKIATNAGLTEGVQNAAPTESHPATGEDFIYEWTAEDDGLYYIGSYNGDMFLSWIIVEANEAPGTPSVKVGAQAYENGLYFREVTCKSANVDVEGESYPTLCTYTTDGSTPTAASPVYKEPIKCYADQTVKFQAYLNLGDGTASEDMICTGADNDAIVSFSFNAPTIAAEGASFTVTSEYEGAENYVSYGEVADKKSNGETLTESATVSAYSKIVNGTYATFTTKSVSKDVYVLDPIKEEKTIAVTSADVVVDEDATATSTTGTVYKVENGVISADKKDFFVKNLEFGIVNGANAQYQVPAGQEAYIKMNATNITFQVAEGDSVDVTVTCTKNACKTINAENDESVTSDRKCYVNVSGKTFGTDDITNGDVANLEGYANVITFGLPAGTHTFQKYSGTGNILISSINIKPVQGTGIQNINADAVAKKIAKKLVNGQIVVETANGTFNAVGARVK